MSVHTAISGVSPRPLGSEEPTARWAMQGSISRPGSLHMESIPDSQLSTQENRSRRDPEKGGAVSNVYLQAIGGLQKSISDKEREYFELKRRLSQLQTSHVDPLVAEKLIEDLNLQVQQRVLYRNQLYRKRQEVIDDRQGMELNIHLSRSQLGDLEQELDSLEAYETKARKLINKKEREYESLLHELEMIRQGHLHPSSSRSLSNEILIVDPGQSRQPVSASMAVNPGRLHFYNKSEQSRDRGTKLHSESSKLDRNESELTATTSQVLQANKQYHQTSQSPESSLYSSVIHNANSRALSTSPSASSLLHAPQENPILHTFRVDAEMPKPTQTEQTTLPHPDSTLSNTPASRVSGTSRDFLRQQTKSLLKELEPYTAPDADKVKVYETPQSRVQQALPTPTTSTTAQWWKSLPSWQRKEDKTGPAETRGDTALTVGGVVTGSSTNSRTDLSQRPPNLQEALDLHSPAPIKDHSN